MNNELNELDELREEIEVMEGQLKNIENLAIDLLSHTALTDSMRQIVCEIIVRGRGP
jgi:hypothetical protein